jgi:hypothetical protein
MSNAIVTTTINPPKEALERFAQKGWHMIVIGDQKTPHGTYKEFCTKYPHVEYLSPEKQDKLYHKLSDNIGWNCIQRRAIGIAHAYVKKFDVVALVDDDNIPMDNWGEEILVGKKVTVTSYQTNEKVFDPLLASGHPELWHRGFPIQLLGKREYSVELKTITVQVQADLWNGDPDIDAICRVSHPEPVEFYHKKFTSNALCPFNSQNTFLSHEALKYYYLLPHIGRMDDIWGSYILQEYMPNSVLYAPPSVVQKRNKHSIVQDLKDEMFGYEHTIELVNDLYYWSRYLPEKTQEFVKLYVETIQ